MQPQNREVGQKLLMATACMVVLPVCTYFVSERWIFSSKQNPDNWAAIMAIVMTNLIVGSYCAMAYWESDNDDDDNDDTGGKDQEIHKKRSVPRVGIYKRAKERTD